MDTVAELQIPIDELAYAYLLWTDQVAAGYHPERVERLRQLTIELLARGVQNMPVR